MLGQPITMLIPQVVGFQLTGRCPRAPPATDLVLTVTEMLRKHGVVGKFVEFFGDGLEHLPLADRATIGNMSPEYGAPSPSSRSTTRRCDYLRLTGRERRAGRARRALREGRRGSSARPERRARLHRPLSSSTSAPSSRASPGPRRPQDRMPLCARRSRSSSACARADAAPTEGGRRAARARAARPRAVGDDVPARARRGRHRGDHELHQHLESGRDDRRRAARQQRGRARPQAQAVGQDEPRARARRSSPTTSRSAGLHDVSRAARLQPGRLRLHDLHRQLRAAARDVAEAIEARTWWSPRCSQRQPQLRGPHPSARAGRTSSPRRRSSSPTPSPARMTSTSTASRSARIRDGKPVYPARHLADARRDPASRMRGAVTSADVRVELRGRVRGRRAAGGAARCRPASRFAWDADSTYVQHPPFFEGLTLRARAARRHPGRARARAARRHGHHRPHLAGRIDHGGQPGRAVPASSTASSRTTSTPTAPAAATTRS